MFVHTIEFNGTTRQFESEFTKPEFVAEDFISQTIEGLGQEVYDVVVGDVEIRVLRKVYLEGTVVRKRQKVEEFENAEDIL